MFQTAHGRFGVPPHVCSAPGLALDSVLPVPRSARFLAADESGQVETIRIEPGAREGSRLVTADLLEALDDQSGLVVAELQDSCLVLRGRRGGAGARLVLRDDWGAPLAALGIGDVEAHGWNAPELCLNVPHAELAGRSFALLASLRAGNAMLHGASLPLCDDSLLGFCASAALERGSPGFRGRLGAGGTGTLTVPEALFARAGYRGALHLVAAVLDEREASIVFVSSSFVIAFEGASTTEGMDGPG